MSYVVYACNQNGEGYSQKIGTFDDLSEIRLRVGLFAPDVVLEIEESSEEGQGESNTATIPSPISPISSATIPNVKLK